MPPPPDPPKRTWLRAAETLAIAAAGGTLLSVAGFPAGLVTGSLVAVAAAALLGRPVMMPVPLSRVILVLVGISLGAAVTPETLQGLARFPLGVALLAMSTLCMIVATTFYLRSVHGWDARSALLGASPGALAQVMAMAAEYRADMPAIAIVQTLRVVLLTVGIPTGLALFGLAATDGFIPRAPAGGSESLIELAILVVLSTAVAVAIAWSRLPGGLLFGALLGSGILHGTGWITVTLPWWVAAAAIVGIGALTGSRFSNTGPRTLLRFVGAALGSFAVAVAIASLFVLILTALLQVRVADAVVAFAPGAQDTMMVLALALHLDPVFVGALHLSRYLLVSLLVPVLALRMGPRPTKHELPPSPRPPKSDG